MILTNVSIAITGSGTIDFTEFLAMMEKKALNSGDTEEELKEAFKVRLPVYSVTQ